MYQVWDRNERAKMKWSALPQPVAVSILCELIAGNRSRHARRDPGASPTRINECSV
jgi:hypothetical protein